ncbi:hypothetical protein BYT27DRAFT_7264088 [Phlegmacium glaucopus]|nr:hypothetical protein BYT27DRAFT_7264088 [Phlegmacium glaucopus]
MYCNELSPNSQVVHNDIDMAALGTPHQSRASHGSSRTTALLTNTTADLRCDNEHPAVSHSLLPSPSTSPHIFARNCAAPSLPAREELLAAARPRGCPKKAALPTVSINWCLEHVHRMRAQITRPHILGPLFLVAQICHQQSLHTIQWATTIAQLFHLPPPPYAPSQLSSFNEGSSQVPVVAPTPATMSHHVIIPDEDPQWSTEGLDDDNNENGEGIGEGIGDGLGEEDDELDDDDNDEEDPEHSNNGPKAAQSGPRKRQPLPAWLMEKF